MTLVNFPPAGSGTGHGPINASPGGGSNRKHITVKNLGPEVAWLADDSTHPLAPGETVSFVAVGSEQYYYATYAPGADLWVWEG